MIFIDDPVGRAKYVMSRGYLPEEKLFARYHIYPWERGYLIEFIRHVRGECNAFPRGDFEFNFGACGTVCGSVACIGGYVWKAAHRDAFERGMDHPPAKSPYGYVMTFAQHSVRLQDLYMANSLHAAAHKDSDLRLDVERITEEEAADAAERALQGRDVIWLPGTATRNIREAA